MSAQIIKREEWMVQRHGTVTEVTVEATGVITYHVEVWDAERQPFLSQWFNDPAPAADFLDRVVKGFDPRKERRYR